MAVCSPPPEHDAVSPLEIPFTLWASLTASEIRIIITILVNTFVARSNFLTKMLTSEGFRFQRAF